MTDSSNTPRPPGAPSSAPTSSSTDRDPAATTSGTNPKGGETQFLGDGAEAQAKRGERVPSLVVLQGRNIGEGFILQERENARGEGIVVGRVRACDITLHDPKVSRLHAKFLMEDDPAGGPVRVRLVDLHSTNGTRVNDAPITEAILREGDKVSIGETLMRFAFQDPVDLQYQSQLKSLLTIDNLTRLYTKRTFDHQFDDALDIARAEGTSIAVLMMDLDHFKSINDTHGHLMGSHVLREVGGLIRDVVDPLGVAGRYGGEEFVAYLPGLALEAGVKVANGLRTSIEAHRFEREGTVAPVTISIGVAACPGDGLEAEMLIQKADEALYRAKATGRNCVASTDDLRAPQK